jgi:hypothetical protein
MLQTGPTMILIEIMYAITRAFVGIRESFYEFGRCVICFVVIALGERVSDLFGAVCNCSISSYKQQSTSCVVVEVSLTSAAIVNAHLTSCRV